jgi:biopolymer transport protein ExbD
MNFRRVFEAREDAFQLAPLIDIVFLLLIFFIVTGALEMQEKETPIVLPETTAAVARPRARLDVVVNITRDGRIWINNQRYTLDRLRRTLVEIRRSARSAPVSVIIRADGKALHEDVVAVIDACTGARLKNVSFVSVNAGTRPTR